MRTPRHAALLAAAVMLAACEGDPSPPPPSPPAPPTQPSSPLVGKDLDLPPPDVQPGYRVLVSKGPVRGPASLGDVRLNKGITWVNVNCVADSGTRTITLDIETVGTFTLECTDRSIGNNVNQLDLAEGRSGRFRVTTTQDVRWAADIQVPE